MRVSLEYIHKYITLSLNIELILSLIKLENSNLLMSHEMIEVLSLSPSIYLIKNVLS